MSLREAFTNLVKSPANHSIYHKIPSGQLDGVVLDDPAILPDNVYIRIKLVQMFLGLDRVWTSARAPVVHAFPKFLHHNGYKEVPVVIGPGKLKEALGDQPYQRMVTMNQTVLGPIPYLGGDLDLVLALFAFETKDYADELLDLLDTVSSVVPVTGLSTAITIMRPMEQGLKKMIDAGNLKLQIGVHDTFANPVNPGVLNPLCSQYHCVIARQEEDLDPNRLWLTGRGLRLDEDGKPGNLLKNCDYFVFKIEVLSHRDWREIETLGALWNKVQEVVSTGNRERIKEAFEQFKWSVLGCGDLLRSDRIRTVMDQKSFIESLFEVDKQEMIRAPVTLGGVGPASSPKPSRQDIAAMPPQVSELFHRDMIDASKLELDI